MSITETLLALPSRTLKWLILVSIGLLFVSAWLIWYGRPSFSEKDVIFQLKGPQQASSGDEAVYSLTFENRTRYDLRNLKVRFTYPSDSVVIKNGVVSAESSEAFTIDVLSSGDSTAREFKAFLVGDKGNIKDARAEIVFNAGSLRSSFQKSVNVSTAIISLPIALTLVAPPSAVSGQVVSYILDYRNESPGDVSDVQFEFKLPDGFSLSQTTPQPNAGQYVWSTPLLRRGSGARILIEGRLSGNERDVKTISVILKRKIDDQYINYEKAESTTIISSPLLSLDMKVNNVPDYTAIAGDDLRYLISYKNNYSQSLIGLTMAIRLEGDMFDLATLEDKEGFFDGATRTVFFNAASAPDLAALPAGKSGSVEFRIKLKPGFPTGISGSRNFFVKATATLSTPNVPTGIDSNEIAVQSSVVTKISTQPTLSQTAYYLDPAFGSSGPFPPQVDQETVFTIHWQLVNPGNDMNEAQVRAQLPTGVVWKNVISSGTNQSQPFFDRNKSEVIWNIGLLPQGVGIFTPKYEASFQVSIKPSIADKGSSPVLIKEAVFSGTDSFTKQNLIVRAADVDTSRIVDRTDLGAVK